MRQRGRPRVGGAVLGEDAWRGREKRLVGAVLGEDAWRGREKRLVGAVLGEDAWRGRTKRLVAVDGRATRGEAARRAALARRRRQRRRPHVNGGEAKAPDGRLDLDGRGLRIAAAQDSRQGSAVCRRERRRIGAADGGIGGAIHTSLSAALACSLASNSRPCAASAARFSSALAAWSSASAAVAAAVSVRSCSSSAAIRLAAASSLSCRACLASASASSASRPQQRELKAPPAGDTILKAC